MLLGSMDRRRRTRSRLLEQMAMPLIAVRRDLGRGDYELQYFKIEIQSGAHPFASRSLAASNIQVTTAGRIVSMMRVCATGCRSRWFDAEWSPTAQRAHEACAITRDIRFRTATTQPGARRCRLPGDGRSSGVCDLRPAGSRSHLLRSVGPVVNPGRQA